MISQNILKANQYINNGKTFLGTKHIFFQKLNVDPNDALIEGNSLNAAKYFEQFKYKTYQNNEENIENNQNILNTEHKNNEVNIQNKEFRYANTEFCMQNAIKGIRINKAFHYFNK